MGFIKKITMHTNEQPTSSTETSRVEKESNTETTIQITEDKYNTTLREITRHLISARARRNTQRQTAMVVLLSSVAMPGFLGLVLAVISNSYSKTKELLHDLVALFTHPELLTKKSSIRLSAFFLISMLILGCFVAGIVYAQRSRKYHFSKEEIAQIEDAVGQINVSDNNDQFTQDLLDRFKNNDRGKDTIDFSERNIDVSKDNLKLKLLYDTHCIHELKKESQIFDMLIRNSEDRTQKCIEKAHLGIKKLSDNTRKLGEKVTEISTKLKKEMQPQIEQVRQNVQQIKTGLTDETERRVELSGKVVQEFKSYKKKKGSKKDEHDGPNNFDHAALRRTKSLSNLTELASHNNDSECDASNSDLSCNSSDQSVNRVALRRTKSLSNLTELNSRSTTEENTCDKSSRCSKSTPDSTSLNPQSDMKEDKSCNSTIGSRTSHDTDSTQKTRSKGNNSPAAGNLTDTSITQTVQIEHHYSG